MRARLGHLLEKEEINGKPIKGGKQVADLAVETILKHALAGNLGFMRLLVDLHDGKIAVATGDGDDATGAAIDPEVARRILRAVRGDGVQPEGGAAGDGPRST